MSRERLELYEVMMMDELQCYWSTADEAAYEHCMVLTARTESYMSFGGEATVIVISSSHSGVICTGNRKNSQP